MDGLEELQDIVIIAATNRPDIIDAGLLRAGRFDRRILVGQPDLEARRKIFEVHTKDMPLNRNIDLGELASRTENYVGADIATVCREAAMLALREDINANIIEKRHMEAALEKVGPSVNKYVEKFYEKIEQQFKSSAVHESASEQPTYMR